MPLRYCAESAVCGAILALALFVHARHLEWYRRAKHTWALQVCTDPETVTETDFELCDAVSP